MIMFFFHDSCNMNHISSPSSPKAPHTITNSSPCLTDRNTHSSYFFSLSFIYTFLLLQKVQILTSSVHNTFCYSFNVTFLCFFAYNSLSYIFNFCNRDFLIAMHLLSLYEKAVVMAQSFFLQKETGIFWPKWVFLNSNLCYNISQCWFVCLFVWVSWHINLLGYLMPNPFLNKSTVVFQTIQFSISTLFDCQKP